MRFAIWAPLLLPLLAAPLLALPSVRSLPDRLPPRLAAWLLTATAVGLAGAGAVALGLLALSALLHLRFVAAMGHLELPFARHLAPAAVVPVGAAAGVLLLVLVVRAARVLLRYRRGAGGLVAGRLGRPGRRGAGRAAGRGSGRLCAARRAAAVRADRGHQCDAAGADPGRADRAARS
ncbi:hypothetical protein [Streptacidiphilus sp. PAMC 29251]